MSKYRHLSTSEFLRVISNTAGRSPIIDELVRRLENSQIELAAAEEEIPSCTLNSTCPVCQAPLPRSDH